MISVIIDENDDDEDENDLGFDEQIGTIENYFFQLWKIFQDLGGGAAAGVALNENDSHGALVQDIIDSKNKIEKNSQKSSRSVMSEAEETKHKKRIEKIRSEIQQISRTAAPIGRVLGNILVVNSRNDNFLRFYTGRYGFNGKWIWTMDSRAYKESKYNSTRGKVISYQFQFRWFNINVPKYESGYLFLSR